MGPAAILSILVRTQGIGVATGQLTQLEAASKRAGDAADSTAARHQKGAEAIRKASMIGTVAVAGLAAGAVKMAADYQTSMNTLQAVSGASGQEMKKLSALAVKLGADVKLPGTSAKDAAEAMTEMVKAGVSVRDTMESARSVLVLSAAAQVSNARAAEIASNALNAFRLKGKDTKLVVDELANTANASSVEINDVADSFKMAAAVFSAFQAPTLGAKNAMTELNVAIGLLGNAGIKGSDAGTSLKQTLLQLTGPSNKARDAMKALYIAAKDSGASEKLLAGITREGATARGDALKSLVAHNKALGGSANIAYDAAGRMRSLRDIIGLVTAGTKDMTEQERNSYLTQIFGADAVRSVTVLMQAQNGQWGKMEKAVGRAGAAQDLANAKMKGLNGAIEALKSTVETLAITFGTTLLPPLTVLLQKLAGLGPFLQQNKTLIMVLVGGLGALAAGTWAVNLAMAANPYVAVAIALAALIAGIVKAYQTSDTFRGIVLAVFNAIKTAFTATVSTIQTATRAVVGEVSQWDTLFSAISRGFGLVKAQAVFFFAALKTIFAAGMLVLGPLVKAYWKYIQDIFSGEWAIIKGIVIGGLQVIRGVILIFGGLFKGDFHQVWEGVQKIFGGGVTALKGILKGAWDILKAPVDAIAAGLHDAFANSWTRIKNLFVDSINAVIGFLNLMIKAINVIPGVPDIKAIGLIGGSAPAKQQNLGQTGHLARGGAFGATGGLVNSPMVFMGEQAPRYPEYVIPTNPAYRKRAHGLMGQAAGALGFASGGVWSKSELAGLWKRVNPGLGDPNLMAAIALAESGGRQGIVNSIGATGLWQIHPGGAQYLDPVANARAAGGKLRSQGLRAWEAYTNGSYKQYLGGGGILGAVGGLIGSAISSIGDILGKLPHPKGLGMFQGLGGYVLGKATDWVKKTVTGLIPGGGGETSTTGLVARVRAALAFARAHGWTGRVTSGFRTDAQQLAIWNSGVRPAAKPKALGGPGSNHSTGQAVDVTDIPGFARAMLMMPPGQRLYSLVPNDPVHFSVSGHALGTAGANRGLAWVGERGPELVRFNGGEQVFNHADSLRMVGGYKHGTRGASQRQIIAAAHRTASKKGVEREGATAPVPPSVSDLLNRDLAFAQLTSQTTDDLAVYHRMLDEARGRLASTIGTGDVAGQTQAAQDIKSLTDSIQQLDDTAQQQLDATNALAEIEKQKLELESQLQSNQLKILALANQGPQILAAVIAAVNGGIGGQVGLGLQSPGYAGGVANYGGSTGRL